MKVSVNRKEFLNSLKIATSVVDKRAYIDVMRCVRLSASAGDLQIIGSNVDTHASSVTSATVERVGACCVDATLLAKIVKASKEKEVTLELDATARMRVDAATLPAIPAEDFPVAPNVSQTFETFIMRAAELAGMIDRVSYAMSDDASRHNLNGAFWTYVPREARLLRLVATDGHRLALTDEREVVGTRDRVLPERLDGVIVPMQAMHAIRELLGKTADETVTVTIAADGVIIAHKRGVVTTSIIDAQFPAYDQVIPSETNCHATFQRDEMIAALEKMRPFVGKAEGAKFSFGSGKITVSVENPTLGSMSAEVAADVTRLGEYSADLVCGFNPRYLLDAISVAGADVHFALSEDLSPATIRSTGIDNLAVVMPMRI